VRAGLAQAQAQQFALLTAQGQAAAERGDWAAALRAYTDALAIQPDGADAAAQLDAARRQLIRTGLAGTVLLRSDGGAAGLYLADGSTPLPGSDGASRVRAVAADGQRFVYDRPALGGGTGTPAVMPVPRADFWLPSFTAGAARVAVLAQLGGAGGPVVQPLPAPLDGSGFGVFLGDVLWWYAPHADLGYYSYTVVYYDLESHTSGVIAGPSGRVQPVAWSPDGSRAVLATYSSVPAGAPPQAQLSLVDAHGQRQGTPGPLQGILGTVEGTLGAAGISPDGRYLFVQTSERGSTTHTLFLADLKPPSGHTPGSFTSVEGLNVPRGVSGGLTAAWMVSPTRLLIDTWSGTQERLALLDPNTDAAFFNDGANVAPQTRRRQSLWQGLSHPDTLDVAALAADGGRVAWRYRAADGADRLLAVDRQSGQQREIALSAVGNRSWEGAFTPQGNYLIYGSYRLDGSAAGRLTPVFSWPLHDSGPPVRLGERVWDAQLPSLVLPAAGSLIAFVTPQHELHAVTPDGRTDLPIATGVAAIWNLHRPPNPGWLH
ncbi:MAG: hypothetical protein M3Z04_14995, partial [Chloroflexota bacterium]|nr:hypothetical protein [Chloroflexota bacterium]